MICVPFSIDFKTTEMLTFLCCFFRGGSRIPAAERRAPGENGFTKARSRVVETTSRGGENEKTTERIEGRKYSATGKNRKVRI